jgi:hypothetical protein
MAVSAMVCVAIYGHAAHRSHQLRQGWMLSMRAISVYWHALSAWRRVRFMHIGYPIIRYC